MRGWGPPLKGVPHPNISPRYFNQSGFFLVLFLFKEKAPYGVIIAALKAAIITYTSRGSKKETWERKKARDPTKEGTAQPDCKEGGARPKGEKMSNDRA